MKFMMACMRSGSAATYVHNVELGRMFNAYVVVSCREF